MTIYLDGCDGSGKSTLAKYLSERFKLDIFCLTKDSEKSFDRYENLSYIEEAVHDRTFISEMVYPKIFGREEWLPESIVDSLFASYSYDVSKMFVICTAPDDIIRERLQTRGDEYDEVIANIEYINSKYKQIADDYDLMVVDTHLMSNEEIGDMIERRLQDGKL